MSSSATRRRRVIAAAVGALLAVTAGATASAGEALPSAAAPTPTPAVPGKPTSIVAVGDSITQATGTGALAQENPKNSWATGTDVNSVANRLGISRRFNVSANGDTMSDFAPQIRNGKSGGSGSVSPSPADAGLVVVEMGGNDLCASSIGEMTSVADYRARFKAGLAQVAAQSPTALVQVMSVPDIYNLWYIRGAPQNATYHPEPQSGQASGINGARFYWGFDVFGVEFPCQSLLANPDSYAQADRDRRSAVRTRTKEYNAVLAEECAKVLRCRFDGGALFDLTSNRVSPPDGPLLPQAQWNFTDLDISRNTASLCPIPGLVGGGCGDHFHPSKQGQGKVAELAASVLPTWADTTSPTAGATVLPSGRPGGVHRSSATVRFSGADAGGLRGQEVRVHRPDGTITAWAPSLGIAPDLTVTDLGTSYVEVRSVDASNNTSASTIAAVTVEPTSAPAAPPAPSVTPKPSAMGVAWSAPDDGGSTIADYTVRAYVGAPAPATATTSATTSARSLDVAPPPAGQIVRYTVAATNGVGTGAESPPSAPALAPFATLDAFAARQHLDFTGASPSQGVLDAQAAALAAGTTTPAALIDELRATPWFGDAYGPSIRLYRAYFLRIPDPSGLDFWANRRRNGATLASISQQFAVSSEFQRRYGSLSNAQFIDQVYLNVFGRAPDPSGRAFYLSRLEAKTWNRGQVVLQFSESGEYRRKTQGIVAVVEYARGMTGRAPSVATFDELLARYEVGGTSAVFAEIVSSAAYRDRVAALG